MNDILPELDGKEYMNGIYKDYDISFLQENEYEDIREFINDYWKENHIFVISKEMFDFQHLDKENHRYNFVIAREKNSKEIHAILGFVPTSQYDSNISSKMIWPCIWKNRKDINRKGLGVTMYYHLKTHLRIETIAILGISEIALSIYKHWNFKCGKINQFVMPNVYADEHISKGLQDVYIKSNDTNNDTMLLKPIDVEEYLSIREDDDIFKCYTPYKSKKYYLTRFFEHPIYKYNFIAIKNDIDICAILITRSCGNGNYNCLRIVDYIGDIKYLSTVKSQLQKYLQTNNFEYIDFVEVGLKDEELIDAGFIDRKDYVGMIVPSYFEPFLQENIELDYAFKTVREDVNPVFFKADADQDRPNIICP